MTLADIKKIAEEKSVKPGKLKKDELIHAIQSAEGNTPCFATEAAAGCPEVGCLWRSDCVN